MFLLRLGDFHFHCLLLLIRPFSVAAGRRLRRVLVLVMATHPIHYLIFITALWHQVEQHQRAERLFRTAGVSGIGMVDLTVIALGENADAVQVLQVAMLR